jgi:hypothetical protein
MVAPLISCVSGIILPYVDKTGAAKISYVLYQKKAVEGSINKNNKKTQASAGANKYITVSSISLEEQCQSLPR